MREMSVTVYTAERFAQTKVDLTEDNKLKICPTNMSESAKSEELSNDGEEFAMPLDALDDSAMSGMAAHIHATRPRGA